MKNGKLSAAVAVATLAASIGFSASPAYAYPTTTFDFAPAYGPGTTAGSVTWYNRSVAIQGYVYDHNAQIVSPDSTTVRFNFWQGTKDLGTYQTRTASNETTSFNFTQDGPAGGITVIKVYLCSVPVYPCTYQGNLVRPAS
ncbi:hypothetical protein [Micromonospora sp. CA-244673]|uniref:hypothetical protein n=1 Tax=Micromonospora sp. CA-244673 TaxID=3239958 RepID=UPI003D92A8DC